jgi:hypothetical protein
LTRFISRVWMTSCLVRCVVEVHHHLNPAGTVDSRVQNALN